MFMIYFDRQRASWEQNNIEQNQTIEEEKDEKRKDK